MKKILKITGYTILGTLVLLYTAFLFLLPNVIDLEQYKADLQKIVKEQSRLSLDYDNMRLITTPFLGVGFKADNITVKLPDNSVLISADNLKTAVSLPHLLLFTINIPLLKFENPFFNAEIMKNGEDYKIVKLIEDIINDKNELTFGKKNVSVKEDSIFDINSLKIIIPNIVLKNYQFLITDLATDNYLDLHGEKLNFGYYNQEKISIKTKAELYSNENKNMDFDIDIKTFLPDSAPKPDAEDDPAEKVDFKFVNPVTTYQNYDLKAMVNSKIRVNRDKNAHVYSFGYFNVEDLTMKISTVQLPSNYLKLKTFGTNIFTDTNINTLNDENLKISGRLKYGKHANADLKIQTSKIQFSNLLTLYKAVLNSLQIPNELNQYKASGSIIADCSIKTNFKKLFSDGFIKIEDGGLQVRNLGQILSHMNVNLILNDDVLDIENSYFNIGGSPVKIDGFIDRNSITDISILTKNVPLPVLFNAFAPKYLRNQYNFKSGNLSSSIKIQGKMKKAIANAVIELNNFDFSDKQKSFKIQNRQFNSNLSLDTAKQILTGKLDNKDFYVLFPKTKSIIKIPGILSEINDGNIELTPNIIYFNDKSALTYSGSIKNYENPQDVNFVLNGEINTNDLIKFIGSELKPFINLKGNIPLNIKFKGDKRRQNLTMQALGDSNNYITPVDFNMLQGLKTMLQTKIDFKPGRIKIKDTGLYTRASVIDESGNETFVLNKIAGIDGTIEDDTINLLKIDIPKALDGKIFVFPNSKFNVENGTLFLYGKTVSPIYRGNLKIKNVIIPEISTSLDSLDLKFKRNELEFILNKIMLVNSDIGIRGKINLSDDTSKIYDFYINSNDLKVEDTVEVSEKLMAYMPKSTESNVSQNIPVSVYNGNIDMKKITTGNIELLNTKSNFDVLKNILALRGLKTNIFNGRTNGDVFVNLITTQIKTDLKGQNINVEKALLDSAGMKNSLSGIAEYSAALVIDGGAKTPEEQMRGITGNVDFNITDGQFGPFGRLENLILAENIRESQFFQTALGGIINSIATIDTTHFSELKGHVSLKDGICEINPITSSGNVMNLHILGNFDLIKNYANMKVRVKLTSVISNLLGPINAINPVNLINSAASMNIVTAKAFSLFCETVSEEEMNVMPKFSNAYVDNSATKFQLGVRGDAAKPLTLIKSFKWLATQMQFKAAKDFTDALPETVEGSENITIETAIEQAKALEDEKKTLKYKIKHLFSKK